MKKKILILRVAKDAKYLQRLRPGNSKGKIITLDWFQDEIRAGRYPKLQRRHALPFSPLNSKGTGHYCIHDNSQVLLHNSLAEQWRGRELNTSVVTFNLAS